MTPMVFLVGSSTRAREIAARHGRRAVFPRRLADLSGYERAEVYVDESVHEHPKAAVLLLWWGARVKAATLSRIKLDR